MGLYARLNNAAYGLKYSFAILLWQLPYSTVICYCCNTLQHPGAIVRSSDYAATKQRSEQWETFKYPICKPVWMTVSSIVIVSALTSTTIATRCSAGRTMPQILTRRTTFTANGEPTVINYSPDVNKQVVGLFLSDISVRK